MFKSLALDHYVLYSQAKLMAFSFVSLKNLAVLQGQVKEV